jgi:hypothetical protein
MTPRSQSGLVCESYGGILVSPCFSYKTRSEYADLTRRREWTSRLVHAPSVGFDQLRHLRARWKCPKLEWDRTLFGGHENTHRGGPRLRPKNNSFPACPQKAFAEIDNRQSHNGLAQARSLSYQTRRTSRASTDGKSRRQENRLPQTRRYNRTASRNHRHPRQHNPTYSLSLSTSRPRSHLATIYLQRNRPFSPK